MASPVSERCAHHPDRPGFALCDLPPSSVAAVFGKRGAAQVAFTFRKRHAREIFALLRERTREAQDRARGASAEAQPA